MYIAVSGRSAYSWASLGGEVHTWADRNHTSTGTLDSGISKKTNGILIVEANPDVQWQLARSLTVRGHRVVGTSSGDGALALISEWPVDLVLIAEDLPGMDGLQVAKGLHRSHPEIPVVLMVMKKTTDILTFARLAGVDACVERPLSADALTTLLDGQLLAHAATG